MTEYLPTLNACLNATSGLLLIAGRLAIRRGDRAAHRRFMTSAVAVSCAFLVSYLVYHALHGSTAFTGQGALRTVYFAVLVSHTVLAAAVVPMALVTFRRGLAARYDRHRAIARWTFPVWLYVSVTGVAVYLMLYHWPG